jgi:membrane protein implicated in regulation of membrane protease activity
MNFQPWALLMAIPPGIVLAYLLWALQRENRRKKDPLTDRGLRPPGEWLRVRIEELNEQMMMRLLYLLAPMFLAIISVTTSHISMPAGIVLLLISAIFSIVAGWKLRTTLNEYRRCRLGFSGERAVGHHLNQLATNGYRVYHDLQFEGFNIDHVLVGPGGVYAVETKTFKKGKGKTSHIVEYDGQKLVCPEWRDARPVEQALRNAKHLSMWLGQSVGQPVRVVPVLTLPGWWVNQTGEGGVTVLNSKQIGGFVSGRPSILSATSIVRISHQVEQKCLL